MKDIIEIIKNKKTKFDALKPFSKTFLTNIEDWYKTELTYTSNAIEGNTLTRQETAIVIEKGLTIEGKSITEHLEAINHAKAYEYISSMNLENIKKINKQIILKINEIILQNIDSQNAGLYRNIPVRIAGSTVVLPNPLKVPDLMDRFIDWLQNSKKNPPEIAIEAHFKFVSIHPFIDGNGRTARLLMNLILLTSGYPPLIIFKKNRIYYINSIEKGQLTGDLSDYEYFMFKAIEKSLDARLDLIKQPTIKTPTKLLKIGELAKETGETIHTLRYWTKMELLKVTKYSEGGYQLYSPDVIKQAKKIRKLQKEKRLTLAELKEII
ncbi:Fic family protein [Candidatus Roizmanbacteria bacterium CG06_land_8_20_14_3_00_34_14]|uniref:Fic family protein n=2 Tax=Candidatus Roizmaniibacteriota TaxID=1752723 RepID=A0A2M7AUG1_9BACT|nr:MAG: Fic family protein [Candidatus Roizmanbacteria bacterium CG07_land_8_20_14_0_80_34_15]PIU74271.1 MAG: Fic family protein [Candidatus Roizmanbacteria bacterium CG06_land_8_20_14_3_00_34_14]